MGEVVGIVAASGQFLEQTIKIISFIKTARQKYKGAPDELDTWRRNMEILQSLVQDVQDTPALQVPAIEPIIVECLSLSNRLSEMLDSLDFETTDPRLKKLSKTIKGMVKEKEICSLVQQIEQIKSSLGDRIRLDNL